jgi:hypothetical protein
MKISELSQDQFNTLLIKKFDFYIEKHEGPFSWKNLIDLKAESHADFIKISNFDVLLPVESEQHKNIKMNKLILSDDTRYLTIFLQNTSYYSGISSGVVAICERFQNETWYVCILYHACLIN